MNNQPTQYPKGTTKEQWDQYYADDEAFEKRMAEIRPKPNDFVRPSDYHKAYSEWLMARSCDAPNKPGYYRANND